MLTGLEHVTAGERRAVGWDLFCRCGWKSWAPTWETSWFKMGRHLAEVGQ